MAHKGNFSSSKVSLILWQTSVPLVCSSVIQNTFCHYIWNLPIFLRCLYHGIFGRFHFSVYQLCFPYPSVDSYCITRALIIVNQQICKCFLSCWRSTDLQHRRPGSTTWADKLNWGISDEDVILVMWVNGTLESENNAERLNKLDNETIIYIFIFSTLANGMHLAKYISLTSCFSIWTCGAERKHCSKEERDRNQSKTADDRNTL